MTDVDLIPFPTGRVPNRPWARDRACDTCLDDALVHVGDDPGSGTGQMAPCPECEAGFMVEFGYGRRSVAVGQSMKHVLYRGRSPWGPGGYWGRAGAAAKVPPVRDISAAVKASWTEDVLVPWEGQP